MKKTSQSRFSERRSSTQSGSSLAKLYKILYIFPVDGKKEIAFRGDSLDALRAFPAAVKREAGFQLDKVQSGEDPDDWKPMSTVGSGVREIRIQESVGIFRVIYIAKFADAVYVLHCFQKRRIKQLTWILI